MTRSTPALLLLMVLAGSPALGLEPSPEALPASVGSEAAPSPDPGLFDSVPWELRLRSGGGEIAGRRPGDNKKAYGLFGLELRPELHDYNDGWSLNLLLAALGQSINSGDAVGLGSVGLNLLYESLRWDDSLELAAVIDGWHGVDDEDLSQARGVLRVTPLSFLWFRAQGAAPLNTSRGRRASPFLEASVGLEGIPLLQLGATFGRLIGRDELDYGRADVRIVALDGLWLRSSFFRDFEGGRIMEGFFVGAELAFGRSPRSSLSQTSAVNFSTLTVRQRTGEEDAAPIVAGRKPQGPQFPGL